MKRTLLLLSLALIATPLFAQTTPANDLGLWISSSAFDDTRIVDPELDVDARLEFDEDLGYGITFNHYWTNQFSTSFGAQRLSADMNVKVTDGPTTITATLGDVDLTVYDATAQWHFPRGARVEPYVGAGVAFVTGDVSVSDFEDPELPSSLDLENETTWLANAGVNFNLTPRLAIGLDGKYIAYEPKGEGDTDEDRVDINPLVLSAGVRLRF